jgi:hypothetical protein
VVESCLAGNEEAIPQNALHSRGFQFHSFPSQQRNSIAANYEFRQPFSRNHAARARSTISCWLKKVGGGELAFE